MVDSQVVIDFIKSFVLKRKRAACDELNEQAGRYGFVMYNVWCDESQGQNASKHQEQDEPVRNLVLRHYYRNDLATPDNDCADTEEGQEKGADICPIPEESIKWRYYDLLRRTNENIAEYARHVKIPGIKHIDDTRTVNLNLESTIPHRLIFTHRDDLLNCTVSSSLTSDPQLHTLASNARATIAAYSKIWPDLEVMFLTDDDCRKALNSTDLAVSILIVYDC